MIPQEAGRETPEVCARPGCGHAQSLHSVNGCSGIQSTPDTTGTRDTIHVRIGPCFCEHFAPRAPVSESGATTTPEVRDPCRRSGCGHSILAHADCGTCLASDCGCENYTLHSAPPNWTYDAAARSIALNLADFCDEELPYPEMIADAARKAASRLRDLEAREAALANAAAHVADELREYRHGREALKWPHSTRTYIAQLESVLRDPSVLSCNSPHAAASSRAASPIPEQK